MNVVGLDLSLAATGLCNDDGPGVITYRMPHDATHYDRAHRLKTIGVHIDWMTRDADVVVIESPFNSKFSSWQLGELHGVVKVTLLQRRVPFQMIAPKQLKKFATNNGNAAKEQVLAAAIRDLDYGGHDNNEADALWLRHMGLAWYLHVSEGDVIAPKYRLEVVRSIRWVAPRERKAA